MHFTRRFTPLVIGACSASLIGCATPTIAPSDADLRGDAPDASTADAREPDASAPIALARSFPIEVLGPEGTALAVEIEIDAAVLAGAHEAAIELVVSNLVGAHQASLEIGDRVIDLSEECPSLLRRQGGTARGSITIEPGSLGEGTARLVFRHAREIRDVSGFRVLDVALRIGDVRIVPGLAWDDPSAWSPIDPSAEAIERGRSYFQDVSRDGGPVCARCHADSGADLQYYAFSDASLVARAMHHQFSRDEAEDIASYIRSLPVVIEGRPYDPPFQPGEDNVGAAGAGLDAILDDDAAFGDAAFASRPDLRVWAWASEVEPDALPTSVQLPIWARWLPRRFDEAWLGAHDGALGRAERALAESPSLENARAFMAEAVRAGRELLVRDGDHAARIELLRFAAVKLWDWSRRNGFERDDRGFPDGGPAYPYEVGFAFFEAAMAGSEVPLAAEQTVEWWWAQVAVDPGRGLSNGERPVNYRDVLLIGELGGLGPTELTFMHLLGSWEESQPPRADVIGTVDGPVRLLSVPLRNASPEVRVALIERWLAFVTAWLADGTHVLDDAHLTELRAAWAGGCAAIDPAQRDALRSMAPEPARAALTACE